MKPLVSVIIPNYNQEKYVGFTLDSVISQDYDNIEIIVVDDGSTDNSVNIIDEYIKKEPRIQLHKQNNLNGAIARNHGIHFAKGDFIYFLDSDDVVYKHSITKMVDVALVEEADLVIGNMEEIDGEGEFIETDIFFEKSGVSSHFTDFLEVMPAPPNKLYKKAVMDKNSIEFGNVRIGQDTNFFLKYLSCCNRIAFITDVIYGWRQVKTSITHAMDFHIFDIVYSFENVRKFYYRIGKEEEYNTYIKLIEFLTYYNQMDKQRLFETKRERRIVIDYFDFYMRKIGDLSSCSEYNKHRTTERKYRLKRGLKVLYTSALYNVFYKIKNRKLLK